MYRNSKCKRAKGDLKKSSNFFDSSEKCADHYYDCLKRIAAFFPFPNHYNGLIANLLVIISSIIFTVKWLFKNSKSIFPGLIKHCLLGI